MSMTKGTPESSQFIAWIERYVAAQPHRFVRGKCAEATTLMIQDFPQLRRTGGFAHWAIPSRDIHDQHWWCVTPEGIIVDPTAEQFEGSIVKVRYEELDLTKEEDRLRIPIGKCMGCGEPTFQGGYAYNFCSERCENDVMEDY